MKFSFNQEFKKYLNYPSSDIYRLKSDLNEGKITIEEIEEKWIIMDGARAFLTSNFQVSKAN